MRPPFREKKPNNQTPVLCPCAVTHLCRRSTMVRGDGVKTWERAGFVQTLFMRCDDTAKGGALVQTI